MVTVTRAVAPTMLLAAGTFAGAAHGAVVTQSFDLTATSTAQTIAIGGKNLYSFVLNGDSVQYARLSTIGDAELSSCTASSSALNANQTFSGLPFAIPIYQSNATVQVGANNGDIDTYTNLRFTLGSDTYYGTATFAQVSSTNVFNARLTQIRYGTLADAQAETPAVPEPAIWAEMIGGLGAVGGALRAARRRKAQALATA